MKLRSKFSVVAPSRLHFGLYGFGRELARQYGGVGAMIESPCVELEASPAHEFEATGPLAERVRQFARRWTAFHRRVGLPRCHIAVRQVPSEHAGLGVGTQLGLAVATALGTFENLPTVTPSELALSVGRGLRSAVGTYGFIHGGLIAERGKGPHDSVSPLDAHVAIPTDWQFVLIRPKNLSAPPGLAGTAEVQAFESLPPVPEATTHELIRLAREQLLPAALQAEFTLFATALDRYCHLAGMCFAAVQGGPFNGPLLTRLADQMRASGAPAVGQSSWGPTLFSILPTLVDAHEFVARLLAQSTEIETTITVAANSGVKIASSEVA